MPQITIDLTDEAYALLSARAERRLRSPERFAESIVSYSLVFGWKDQLDTIRKIREAVWNTWIYSGAALANEPATTVSAEHLSIIHRSAKNADELLEQIAPGTMDIIGDPPWPIPPQNFPIVAFNWLLTSIPIQSFLGNIWEIMRGDTRLKPEHTIELHLEPGIPNEIRANEDMLKNALCNLLSNAIRFSPEGGKIRLTVRRVDKDLIVFVIQDEGIGMPAEFLPRFGERFAFVDSAQKFGGIGAYIANVFAQRHGGKLWAESPGLGQGSTIYLTTPMICPEFTWHDPDYQGALEELKHSQLLVSTWLAEAEWLTAQHKHFDEDARSAIVTMAKSEQERVLALLEELEKDHAKDHD